MAVAIVFWAARVRTLNGSTYSKAVLLLCFAVCFYILGYAMEINVSTPEQILFWNGVQYLGIPFVSALWLTTALMYTGHFFRHKALLSAAIFIIPVITLVLRFTNEFHLLYFQSLTVVESLGGLYLVKTAGPWMYVQLIHSMLMILVAMGLFIADAVRNEERFRGKALLTIVASIFAISGLILTQAKPGGLYVDYMALCLPTTSVLIIFAIARYDLLETKSATRSRVFELGDDAILLVNQQYKVLDYNKSAEKLFDKIGIHLETDYLPSLFKEHPALLEALKKTAPSVVELQQNAGGHYYDITTKRIDEKNELRGWIKTIHDATEIHQLNEELKRIAMTDELSVLSNRRAFINLGRERVEASNEKNSTLYLAMMDLDHFKNVNDRYGHAAGDLVIHKFGRMLKDHFPEDCLVARLGGEEFAVLCGEKTDDEISCLLDTFLLKAEKHAYAYRNDRFHVTVSIGMTKKEYGQTLEHMMRKADEALYRSKDLGRNRLTVL